MAIGGLHPYDARGQVTVLKQVRDTVGPHTYLHEFGIGMSLPLIKTLRECQLLDSLDVSTPERAIRNGSIPDATIQQREFATPYGEDSTTVRSQFASAILTSINYLLSDKVNEQKLDEMYHQETELGAIEDVIRETDVTFRHDLSFPVTDGGDASMDGQATMLNSVRESLAEFNILPNNSGVCLQIVR